MTLPTGSQYSSFPLFVKHNLETRPQDFRAVTDADITAIEQKQAARRAVEDQNKPHEPLQVELNRLRGQLFSLQMNAKGTEQTVNNTSGNVRLFETRLTEALKTKKKHEDAGNLLGARTYEHQVQELENELLDARDRLVKEQRWNSGAARELRTWQTDNGPRLLELKKELGA